MIVLDIVFQIFFSSAMIGLMTFDSIAGKRILQFSMSAHQGVRLLLGALFLIIGQIFTQSVRISDENRQIV